MPFNELPLHDAALAAIHISWEASRCDFRIYPVGDDAHWLVFEGFTKLDFPKNEAWGPSDSINTLRELEPGLFEIELQSGDLLRISALQWKYHGE